MNRPLAATTAAPSSLAGSGTSPQITKPIRIAHTIWLYWNGATSAAGALR